MARIRISILYFMEIKLPGWRNMSRNIGQKLQKIRAYKALFGLTLLLSLVLLPITTSGSSLYTRSSWGGIEGKDSPYTWILESEQKASSRPLTSSTRQTQYIAHDSILIMRNEDFAALGFPGNRILANPYIIEVLNNTSSTTGFEYSHGPIGLILSKTHKCIFRSKTIL